jgi:hypothetical protein
MSNLSAWTIQGDKPIRLQDSSIDLEKRLEFWIEKDPFLIQNGLVIVARQLILEGGRLDLLAIDPQGRWVVIEIKAGALQTGVITQALFYVSQIAKMPFDELSSKVSPYLQSVGLKLSQLLKERGVNPDLQKSSRETIALIVGTSRTAGLDKLLDYLGNEYGFPISAIIFDVLETERGEKVLIRELTEGDFKEKIGVAEKLPKWNMEYVQEQAKKLGTDGEVERMKKITEKFGLYIRPYASSIMITPSENKTRMLFTIWLKRNKDMTLKTFIGTDVFTEFYSVTNHDSLRCLGNSGWRNMSAQEFEKFIQGLDELLSLTI